MLNKYHNQCFRTHLTKYQVSLGLRWRRKKAAEERWDICFHVKEPSWQPVPVPCVLKAPANRKSRWLMYRRHTLAIASCFKSLYELRLWHKHRSNPSLPEVHVSVDREWSPDFGGESQRNQAWEAPRLSVLGSWGRGMSLPPRSWDVPWNQKLNMP